MQLKKHSDLLWGNPHHEQLISSVRSHSVAVRSDSANHPNINQPWWVLHCLRVLPGEKKIKIPQKLQVNLSQKQHTIQQCQLALDDAPCKASVKRSKHNKVISSTLKLRSLTSVTASVHDLSVFGD